MTLSTSTMTRRQRKRSFYPLTVTSIRRVAEDAVAVTFEVPEDVADLFVFRPGQSLTLRRVVDGVEQQRSYSICAPTGQLPQIGVRSALGGVFSRWLTDEVRPGDVIEVQPPSGRFTIDPASGGRHVLIAAGSGITPILSIAASLLTNPDAQVTLLYGNRRSPTVMFAAELADLQQRYPTRFDLIQVLSREPQPEELFSGRLDADRVGRILDRFVPVATVDGFWLCGPYPMVEGIWQLMRDLGVGKRQVHTELFFVENAPPAPKQHREATDPR